jgi:hypothetical protein
MKIASSYKNNAVALKGNLHTHTINSPCGLYPLEDIVNVYAGAYMNYDFLAITDHYSLTDISAVQGTGGMVVFSGVEFKKEHYQTLGINITSYNDDKNDETNHQAIFDEVRRQGGINIICHPHIDRENYWPLEKLLALDGYSGVEIYNHNVRMNSAGRAVALDIWDALLSRGRRVFGIASDDFHHCSRYGGAFIVALAAEKSGPAILDAVRSGSFYASTGIILKDIAVRDGKNIGAAIANERVPEGCFSFIGKEGKLLAQHSGNGAFYTAKGDEGYIRVEVSREDGARAWTQPFWVEP